MNIDVINKQVSKDLSIDEKKVALINTFYWQKIKTHIYDYNPTPLNIENLFVLYPDKWLLKKYIYMYVRKTRAIKNSTKFKIGSVKHLSYIENYSKILRHYLKLRKHYKYTN
jgi:hypothetical protein